MLQKLILPLVIVLTVLSSCEEAETPTVFNDPSSWSQYELDAAPEITSTDSSWCLPRATSGGTGAFNLELGRYAGHQTPYILQILKDADHSDALGDWMWAKKVEIRDTMSQKGEIRAENKTAIILTDNDGNNICWIILDIARNKKFVPYHVAGTIKGGVVVFLNTQDPSVYSFGTCALVGKKTIEKRMFIGITPDPKFERQPHPDHTAIFPGKKFNTISEDEANRTFERLVNYGR